MRALSVPQINLTCIYPVNVALRNTRKRKHDLINMVGAQKLQSVLGKFDFFFLSVYKSRVFEVGGF